MSMENFETILDTDEIIIKEYKPNKTRSITFGIVSLIPLLIIGAIFFGFSLFQFFSVNKFMSGEDVGFKFAPYIFLGFGILVLSFFLFLFIYGIIYAVVSYRKILYCLTNKRIIIRSGFIGVDFHSLDIKAISSINVKVGLFDKWVKPNTGTIIFGSSTTPLGGQGKSGGRNGFAFAHLENPYEVYKEIKEMSEIK